MNSYSILMVDDDPYVLSSLGKRFEKKGYQVKTVDNAEEAIVLLNQTSVDLVMTDLVMEGTGGIDILKKAKALNPETMVIILTGFGEMDSERDAFKLDADDFLLKTSEPKKIYRRVAVCLEKLDLKRNIKQQSEVLVKATRELQREIELRKQKEEELLQVREKIKTGCYEHTKNPDEPDTAGG